MRKKISKIVTLILATVITISMFTGCGSKVEETNAKREENGVVTDVKERGLSFSISQEYVDKGVTLEQFNENLNGNPVISIYYYYRPVTDKLFDKIIEMEPEERTKEVEDEFYKEMAIHSKCLMNIVLLTKDEYKEATGAGKTLDELSGFNNTEKYGENDGYIYLLSIPDNDTKGMSEEEKQQYEECKTYMSTVKENLAFIPVELESNETELLSQMPSFTTKDLQGNTVTEAIFAEKDLTVVNVWGTFCGPCIEEMPELGEWAKTMPDNVQIVGLITDIDGDKDTKNLELAKNIVSKANAEFVQMIGNDEFKDMLSGIVGVPTTFFVDKQGNVVGEAIVGADVDGYKKFVEDYFNE